MNGLVALGGLICGLPGCATVRWVFNFIEKNRDAGIVTNVWQTPVPPLLIMLGSLGAASAPS